MGVFGGAAPVAYDDTPGFFPHRPSRNSIVRTMAPGEADSLGAVFFRSVHHAAARAYSEVERNAWAPAAPSGDGWRARLEGQETVVAEVDGRLRGFMSLSLQPGYFDLAFVEKGVQGQGVSDALYLVLESRARAGRVARLHSDASHLARP
ncbi:MAG: GNAT family N-acetyltransferase, partial [Pseudomonadota bacterium]